MSSKRYRALTELRSSEFEDHYFNMKNLLSILFVILACDHIANGYRILGIFPVHSKSHWTMHESLMVGLARRGHQVNVVTHFPLKRSEPNYKEISLEGSVDAIVNNLSATNAQRFNELNIAPIVDFAGKKTCELLNHPKLRDLIENPTQDPPYDLVITELFASPCYLAFGRHLKIPVIVTVSNAFYEWFNEVAGNPACFSYVPSVFSTFSQQMTFKERLLNFLISNYVSLQFHYYTNPQVEVVKKYFDIDVSHIKDLYNDIALYLVNSHHSLNGIRPMTSNVIEVGGLHLRDSDGPLSPEVQKWLDESKDGCVYFTFGSMVRIETFSKEKIEQFYASFENIAPVRVLMKVAKKEDLLPGLPKNVMTQSWFPQKTVLKHKNIRAFITHGGILGTQEAVYFGIPMIGIPLYGDQHVNIKNCIDKKIIISFKCINDVTEAKLTSALNTILKNPIYRTNIQKLSKIFLDRPMSPLNTSIFWVEYIAKYGNVLQSPATRLYWWQRELLDVFAFILLMIIIALFILQKLMKFLFGSRAKRDSADMKSKRINKKNL